MPFLYKVEIKDSPFHGKGVFSLEEIPQGVVYWVTEDPNQLTPVYGCNAQPNKTYTKYQLQAETDQNKLQKILHGGFYYADADIFIELRDGAQFMNHSQNCNSQIIFDQSKQFKKLKSFTIKEIKKGEEITENYSNYLSQAQWISQIMQKYAPERKKYEDSVKKSIKKVLI